jgi:hypothetical protein
MLLAHLQIVLYFLGVLLRTYLVNFETKELITVGPHYSWIPHLQICLLTKVYNLKISYVWHFQGSFMDMHRIAKNFESLKGLGPTEVKQGNSLHSTFSCHAASVLPVVNLVTRLSHFCTL